MQNTVSHAVGDERFVWELAPIPRKRRLESFTRVNGVYASVTRIVIETSSRVPDYRNKLEMLELILHFEALFEVISRLYIEAMDTKQWLTIFV